MFMGFIYKNIDTKYDKHIYIYNTNSKYDM